MQLVEPSDTLWLLERDLEPEAARQLKETGSVLERPR